MPQPLRTPYTMWPWCAPIWYKAANVYTIQPVYRGVASLCALLREQLELARSRQLRRDRRLAHSRRATKEDQPPGSPTALAHTSRDVRPRQRALENRGLKATCATHRIRDPALFVKTYCKRTKIVPVRHR